MSTVDDEVLDTSQTDPGGPGRLPALDGLRAVAVLAVMLFHTSASALDGGYLGVDVFFVLSGFLITGILVDQWNRKHGLSLGDFFLRRARRLAPALLLLLLTLDIARMAVPQASTDQWRGEILAALSYTTNWFQILSGADYFGQFGLRSPLLHTWSLAIEEQFYLLLALTLAIVLPRMRRRGLGALLGVLALISVVWMAWLAQRNAVWAYYGTGTRMQALLIGSVLALWVRRTAGRWWAPGRSGTRQAIGALAVVGMLALMLHPLGTKGMLSGGFAVGAVLAAALIWSALAPGPLAQVLGWRPLVLVGTISYGIYLWHWPIFLWLRTTDDASAVRQIGAFLLTFAVAGCSYVLIERPVREGRFTSLSRARQWGSYAAAAALIALCALLPARVSPANPGLTWPPAAQVPSRIFVGGDSTMFTLGSHFPADVYPDAQVGGPTEIGCGLVTVAYVQNGATVEKPECSLWPQKWRDEMQARQPQASVIGSLVWDTFDRSVEGMAFAPGSPQFDDAYRAAFQKAATIAGRGGDVPVYVLGIPCMGARIDQSVLNDAGRTRYLDGLVRSVAEGMPNVHYVDLAPLTCGSDGVAVVTRDGTMLRDDGVHWTSAGAQEVWELLLDQMAADGVGATSSPAPGPTTG